MLFDNSAATPVLAAKGDNGDVIVENEELYLKIYGRYKI